MNIGQQGVFFDQLPKHDAAHRCALLRHKHRVAVALAQQSAPRLRDIALQPITGFFTKRHQAFFVTFARHAQHAFAQIQTQHRQVHQLAHAQTTGIQQLQHGTVTQAQGRLDIGRIQQAVHLLLTQTFRQALRLLGRQEFQGGVRQQAVVAQGPAVKAPEHGHAAVRAAGLGVVVAVREITLNIGLLGVRQTAALAVQPRSQSIHVTPVCRQREFGQTILQP